MNSNNTYGSEERISEIIENTSSLRELTYSYIDIWSNKYLNETLFIDYLGLPQSLKNAEAFILYMQEKSNSDQEIFLWIKNKTQEKLAEDIAILKLYLEECDDSGKEQIKMLIASLEFSYESIDFELEAAWYITGLSSLEEEEKTQKLYDLDELMFWEHISKNPDFLKETYWYLRYLYEKFWEKLSESEKRKIKQWLEKVSKQLINLTGDDNVIDSISSYVPEQESKEFEELKNITISREDYTEIFDAFFEVSWVPQRSREWNFWSFFDGDDFYGIPDNAWYDTKTLYEILKLAPHETWHYINLKVTNDRWDIKRPGDMEKEEWLAKVTEKLVSWISLESMNSITFSAPSVTLARLMKGDDFSNFQDAYGSLLTHAGIHSNKRDFIKEFLRKKRWFSKKLNWGSNKDASYSLWLFSVLEYIKNWNWGVENLFWGKISMEDVKSGKFIPEGFWNEHISHIILTELIFFYIRDRKKIKEDDWDFHTEFVNYLKEKYKWLSDSFYLFNEAEKFVLWNRRKVMKILKIVEKAKNVSSNWR